MPDPILADRFAPARESWRPQREASDTKALVRQTALMVAAVAGFGALAGGGYALLHGRSRAVPVIEADSRPLRVKPDNPGGMQISREEQQIMDAGDSSPADVMAPGPETPAPELLASQIQTAHPTAPPAAPAAPAPVAMDEPPAAAPVSPAPPAVAPHAVAAPAGKIEVQLAAVTTHNRAMAEWARLSKKLPDLLASRRPAIVRTEQDGKTFYRLRTGGFADAPAAAVFCDQVREKGAPCAVIHA